MNPYIILGLVIAWIASLGAVGWWQNQAGHTDERVTWQARENKELQDANASIKRLEEAARAAEQAHATMLAKIGENHQKEIADAAAQKERDVAAARSGRIVLRIPAPCKGANGSAAAKTPATPGVGDGGATAELPRSVTEDLLSLANDADSVADQLRQCQKVILDDRAQ